jgi:hypothetical protein
MLCYNIAFVALVPPFETFERAARGNFAVFFFAQRGVTALVATGGVAEPRVSGFVVMNSESTKRFSGTQPGKTWGTDQERHATRVKSRFHQTLILTERWFRDDRDHVGEVKK